MPPPNAAASWSSAPRCLWLAGGSTTRNSQLAGRSVFSVFGLGVQSMSSVFFPLALRALRGFQLKSPEISTYPQEGHGPLYVGKDTNPIHVNFRSVMVYVFYANRPPVRHTRKRAKQHKIHYSSNTRTDQTT